MQTVLIADTPEACTLLQAILDHQFHTICASTFSSMQREVETQSPDAVICGCHFDEGRMYDVLRFLRTRRERIPFMAVRVLSGGLDDAVYEAVKIATRALDGDAFVDLFRWEAKYGSVEAQKRLTSAVSSLLDPRDSRND